MRETRDGSLFDARWIVRSPCLCALRPADRHSSSHRGKPFEILPGKVLTESLPSSSSSYSVSPVSVSLLLPFPPPPPSFRTVRRTTKENRIINAHLDWILIISPLRKTKLSGQLPVYLIARLKRRSREQEIYSRFISLIVGEVELRKLPRMAWHRSKSLKRDVNTRRFHPPSLHARVIYASAGRNRTGSMKLDYGHDIGFAANSNPDVINLSRGRETTIVGQRVYPTRKRTYVRGENDPRPAIIDIELDCSPLTRHDRPSIPHYAGAIVMPGAVIADYTLVMPI